MEGTRVYLWPDRTGVWQSPLLIILSSADKKAHVQEAEIIISNLQVKKVKNDSIKIAL